MNKIIAIFDEAQRSHQLHKKLHQNLNALVSKEHVKTTEELYDAMFSCFRHALLVFEKEPAVERIIDFVVSFAATKRDSGDDFDGHAYLLRHLVPLHDAANKAVRYRVCQIAAKILKACDAESVLDDDLWDAIQTSMTSRARDKIPAIRAQAANALERLQDPANSDCPVVALLSHLAECDSSPDVRKTALECLAIQSIETKALAIGRTRDAKETVRRAAYAVLGDQIPNIRQYTIAERVELLRNGLADPIDAIRVACRRRLLARWLASVDASVCELLVRLDVESLEENVVETILRSVFDETATPVSKLVDDFASSGIVEGMEGGACRVVVEPTQLDSERALYWRCLCQYLKDKGEVDLLDAVLPEASVTCAFIERFAAENVTSEVVRAPELALSVEFVLQQLLKITRMFDSSDEVGKVKLKELVCLLLSNQELPLAVIPTATKCLVDVCENEMKSLEMALSIISEIHSPLDDSEPGSQNPDFCATMSQPTKDDPVSLLRCLTLCCEILKQLNHIPFTASLQALCDFLVLPAFQNEEEVIRTQAITALGLLALLSPQLAQRHIVLFLQAAQVDGNCARIAAICVIFDLFLVYGMDHFHGSEEEKEEASGENEDEATDPSLLILNLLSDFLDDENSDLRSITAEGIAKLLLSGRLCSAKFLSHLLLLWYNPMSGDLPQMRRCLGDFFPLFAFKSLENQQAIADIFVPTLRILLDAPPTSPLTAVNVANVSEFMVHLINPNFLKDGKTINESVHLDLAVKLCQLTLDHSERNGKFWCRCLNLLDVPKTEEALEVLCGLIDEMTEIVQDKMCLKWIAKFKTSLLGTAAVSHTGTLAKGADTGERSEGDDASTDGSNVRKKKPRNKGIPQTPATRPTQYKKSSKNSKTLMMKKKSDLSRPLISSDLSDQSSEIEWDESSDI